MEAFLLLLGLAGLWFGSQNTIQGALKISRRLGIPSLIIGLTILAVGTDLPEIFIAITAGLEQRLGLSTAPGIIMGDALGSTLGQATVILGIVGFSGLILLSARQRKNGILMPVALLLLMLLADDGFLSYWDGVALIVAFVAYVLSVLYTTRQKTETKTRQPVNFLQAIIQFVGGLALVLFASKLTVDNALLMSETYGISQTLLGMVVIGLGTSLPELATSLAAVRHKEGGIALGNIIGSCILDTLLIPGLGAVVAGGINVPRTVILFHLPATLIAVVVVVLLFYGHRSFGKIQSAIALALYPLFYLARFALAFFGV